MVINAGRQGRPDADEVLQALGHLRAVDVQVPCKALKPVSTLSHPITDWSLNTPPVCVQIL